MQKACDTIAVHSLLCAFHSSPHIHTQTHTNCRFRCVSSRARLLGCSEVRVERNDEYAVEIGGWGNGGGFGTKWKGAKHEHVSRCAADQPEGICLRICILFFVPMLCTLQRSLCFFVTFHFAHMYGFGSALFALRQFRVGKACPPPPTRSKVRCAEKLRIQYVHAHEKVGTWWCLPFHWAKHRIVYINYHKVVTAIWCVDTCTSLGR